MTAILPIVEGEGDATAVPELIRRVAYQHGHFDVRVLTPHQRGDLKKVLKNFDSFLNVAAFESAPILWVLDYDGQGCDDVERDLVMLRQKAVQANSRCRIEFAFMVKEYETLFLADHETTCQVFADIPTSTAWPTDPEAVRGAKEWLSNARSSGRAYKQVAQQAKLTARLDLERLRVRSKSFVRFEAALQVLLATTPPINKNGEQHDA